MELIVIMTLLGLIMAAVVPCYGRFLSAGQVRGLHNDMIRLIGFGIA